eukprot:1793454-Rhodomonas_salina.1
MDPTKHGRFRVQLTWNLQRYNLATKVTKHCQTGPNLRHLVVDFPEETAESKTSVGTYRVRHGDSHDTGSVRSES